jgi:hypothetical protein
MFHSGDDGKHKYCALALVVMFNNNLKETSLTEKTNNITKTTIEETCDDKLHSQDLKMAKDVNLSSLKTCSLHDTINLQTLSLSAFLMSSINCFQKTINGQGDVSWK